MTVDSSVIALIVATIGALLNIAGMIGLVAFLRNKVGDITSTLKEMSGELKKLGPDLAELQSDSKHNAAGLSRLEERVAALEDRERERLQAARGGSSPNHRS